MWRRRSSRADEEIFGLYLRAVRFGAPPASVSLKASQSFAAGRRKKIQSFSPATCASEKILFRLQVWNLCAAGTQIMRAADCRPFVGKPLGFFDRQQAVRFTDSNLNHTGIYLYSKGKIMIHLTFDYKTDEKCTTPGQYLKYHRTFQGLSTRELAEKVGIVPATLVLYENDRHPIKHSTAVALANALGIDRNRLLDKYTAFVDYPYSSLLKKVRQDLSLTQIQMAELIGIGQTSYSGWEREIRVPRRKEYDKILAALEKLRVNVDTYLCQSASI